MSSPKKVIRTNQALEVFRYSTEGMSIIEACQIVGMARSTFFYISCYILFNRMPARCSTGLFPYCYLTFPTKGDYVITASISPLMGGLFRYRTPYRRQKIRLTLYSMLRIQGLDPSASWVFEKLPINFGIVSILIIDSRLNHLYTSDRFYKILHPQ